MNIQNIFVKYSKIFYNIIEVCKYNLDHCYEKWNYKNLKNINN